MLTKKKHIILDRKAGMFASKARKVVYGIIVTCPELIQLLHAPRAVHLDLLQYTCTA
jgi:hypothetical protein